MSSSNPYIHSRKLSHHLLGQASPDFAAQALLFEILDASGTPPRARRASLRASWAILRIWRSMLLGEELLPTLDFLAWPALDDYCYKLTRRRDLPRGYSASLLRVLRLEFAPQLDDAFRLPLSDTRNASATRSATQQWWAWTGAASFSDLGSALMGHGLEILDRVELPSDRLGLRPLLGLDGPSWILPQLRTGTASAWLDPGSPARALRRSIASLDPDAVLRALRDGAAPAETDWLGLDAMGALATTPCSPLPSLERRAVQCAAILSDECDPNWVWSAHPWAPDPAQLAESFGRHELASFIRAFRERLAIDDALGESDGRGTSGRRL